MPGETVFKKSGPRSALTMFEAEAEGLRELAASGTVRVPEVIDVGVEAGGAYIELERLDLRPAGAECGKTFGRQVADLHRTTVEQFGWTRDNTIGPTAQPNPWTPDWIGFFGKHRLRFQLDLAARNGHGGELQRLGERVIEYLPGFFEDYHPEPALLHGDLWSGNWGMANGEPVTYDPAVYYGDRESDLAMARLFGGFPPEFFAAYEAEWPLTAEYKRRNTLYQLYHMLNHLNLFGAGYYSRTMQMLRELARR